MTFLHAKRISDYRKSAAQRGIKRIEITLPADVLDMLDGLAQARNMTRGQYISTIINRDFHKYHER